MSQVSRLNKFCFCTLLFFLVAGFVVFSAGRNFVYATSPTVSIRTAVTQYAGCNGWTYVHSPSPVNPGSTFNAVATISSNDAWAVGYTLDRKSVV